MEVPEIDGMSAGGMPGRVKCLHVQLGHALGAGPGVNPFGDETLAMIAPWWQRRSVRRYPMDRAVDGWGTGAVIAKLFGVDVTIRRAGSRATFAASGA